MPKRFQLKRTKGWKKPVGSVVVSRPSVWGNPYKEGTPIKEISVKLLIDAGWVDKAKEDIEHLLTRQEAIHLYGIYIKSWSKKYSDIFDLEKLRGKDLGCWCRLDERCHADVLLKLANEEIA